MTDRDNFVISVEIKDTKTGKATAPCTFTWKAFSNYGHFIPWTNLAQLIDTFADELER